MFYRGSPFSLESSSDNLPESDREGIDARSDLFKHLMLTSAWTYSNNLGSILKSFPRDYTVASIDNSQIETIESDAVQEYFADEQRCDTFLLAGFLQYDETGQPVSFKPSGGEARGCIATSVTASLGDRLGGARDEMLLVAAVPVVFETYAGEGVKYSLRWGERIAGRRDLPIVPVYEDCESSDFLRSRYIGELIDCYGLEASPMFGENYARLNEGLRRIHCPRSGSEIDWAMDDINRGHVASLLGRVLRGVPPSVQPFARTLEADERGELNYENSSEAMPEKINWLGGVFVSAFRGSGFSSVEVLSFDEKDREVYITAREAIFYISFSDRRVTVDEADGFLMYTKRLAVLVLDGVGYDDALLGWAELNDVACFEYSLSGSEPTLVPFNFAAEWLIEGVDSFFGVK